MSDLLSLYETLKSKKWVDLSHVINESSPHFPALPALEKEDLFTLKDGFHVQKISVVGQYGTHIDAPIHFVAGGRWLDQIELKDLLLPLYVIDKSAQVAENPNYILTKQDILDFLFIQFEEHINFLLDLLHSPDAWNNSQKSPFEWIDTYFFDRYLMDPFCNKMMRLMLIEQLHNKEIRQKHIQQVVI